MRNALSPFVSFLRRPVAVRVTIGILFLGVCFGAVMLRGYRPDPHAAPPPQLSSEAGEKLREKALEMAPETTFYSAYFLARAEAFAGMDAEELDEEEVARFSREVVAWSDTFESNLGNEITTVSDLEDVDAKLVREYFSEKLREYAGGGGIIPTMIPCGNAGALSILFSPRLTLHPRKNPERALEAAIRHLLSVLGKLPPRSRGARGIRRAIRAIRRVLIHFDSKPITIAFTSPAEGAILNSIPTIAFEMTDTGSGPDPGSRELEAVNTGPQVEETTNLTSFAEVILNDRVNGIVKVEAGGIPSDTLQDGVITLEASGTDRAGNPESVALRTITLDRHPPQIAIDSPEAGSTLLSTTVRLAIVVSDAVSGVEADTVKVSLNGQALPGLFISVGGSGQVTVSGSAVGSLGTNTLTVEAGDNAGNVVVHSTTFSSITLPRNTEGGLSDLFINEEVLSVTETQQGPNEFARVTIVKTGLKYPLIRVLERFTPGPAPSQDTITFRTATVADHVLVGLQDGKTRSDLEALAAVHGMSVGRKLYGAESYFVHLPQPTTTALPLALTTLLANPDIVASADPDYVVVPTDTTPMDNSFPQQWGMAKIEAPKAWDYGTGSFNVLVGVVDTGIHMNWDLGSQDEVHYDFDHAVGGSPSNIWRNPDEILDGLDNDGNGLIDDLRGWNFYDNDNLWFDVGDHGTLVAGIIGAAANNPTQYPGPDNVVGVSWTVTIVPIKMFGNIGGGPVGYMSDAAQATNYASQINATTRCDISNNSYLFFPDTGVYDPANNPSETFPDGATQLSNAIALAQSRGLLFVAGAGNDRRDIDNTLSYPAAFSATHPNVLTVGATDDTDILWVDPLLPTRGSNWGIGTVQIAAPGADIFSCSSAAPWYALKSGTSLSAPHVAGAVALLKSMSPNLTYLQLKDEVLQSADIVPGLSGLIAGSRRLNVYKAVRPNLSFTVGSPMVAEDGSQATITVRRAGAVTGIDVSVDFATSDGSATAGEDYVATFGTLTWASGDSSDKLFTVTIIDDNVVTGDRTVNLTLSNPNSTHPSGAFLGSLSTATLTIIEDESAVPPPIPSFTLENFAPFLKAGNSSDVTVVARNGDGTVFSGFTGNATMTLTGTAAPNGSATFPGSIAITFTAADAGTITLPGALVFAEIGIQTISVVAQSDPTMTGASQIEISASDPADLEPYPQFLTFGTENHPLPQPLMTRVVDTFGNPVVGETVRYFDPSDPLFETYVYGVSNPTPSNSLLSVPLDEIGVSDENGIALSPFVQLSGSPVGEQFTVFAQLLFGNGVVDQLEIILTNVSLVAPDPPVITSPATGTTSTTSTVTVSGTGIPGLIVRITVDGFQTAHAFVDGLGVWTVDIPALSNGSHTIFAYTILAPAPSGVSNQVDITVAAP